MRALAAAVALVALAGPARAADSSLVLGTWWTEHHDGVVRLSTCPAGLCGTVVGIADFRPDGSPPLDYRGRSRCHLEIIPDGRVDSDGIWESHVTNPDDGKTYNINLHVDRAGRLRMRGYIGIPLFGRTTVWTRFSGRLTPDCHIVS